MGSKKRSAKKIEPEEDAASASTSSIATISDDDEEANKDFSLEIIQKALLNRATNPPNDTVLVAPIVSSSAKVHSEEIKSQLKKKKKKKNKLESDIETVVIAEQKEKEAVEKIASEKVEHAELETGVVDMSDNVVLRNSASELLSKDIKTQKKKKKKKHESEIQTAVIVEEENEKEAAETTEIPEKLEAGEAETRVVNTSDNAVLRKLLRGPRYFDPPSDSVWGTCFNCGEEGHATFNCTAAKRRKPCFICGSLSHNVKKCTMARYCSICKLVGHRSKDCSKKDTGGSISKSLTVCLRCGNSGHDMFLCRNDYWQDDLKEIQCYVCKRFGHLCCINTTDDLPKEISCYRCGQMGHIGWACSRVRNEATDGATPSSCYKCGEKGHFARECSSSVKASSRWQPQTNDPATPSSCYRCGEEGHFSRECSSSVKIGNGKHKFSSTERPRSYMEESDIKTPKKSKHRGGWMTEHHGEFSSSNSRNDSWRSPITSGTQSTKGRFHNNGSNSFSSRSFKMRNVHDGTPNSEGSARDFHHRYSASRFGNSNSNGFERSYNEW